MKIGHMAVMFLALEPGATNAGLAGLSFKPLIIRDIEFGFIRDQAADLRGVA